MSPPIRGRGLKFDHVVTDPPGLKIDDFETVGEVEELTQKVDSFLRS